VGRLQYQYQLLISLDIRQMYRGEESRNWRNAEELDEANAPRYAAQRTLLHRQ